MSNQSVKHLALEILAALIALVAVTVSVTPRGSAYAEGVSAPHAPRDLTPRQYLPILMRAPVGSWSLAGSMNTERYDHAAILLATGQVLVAGGFNDQSGWLASAELYDPASNTWASTGSMSAMRRWFTATLLHSGKALVAGGDGSDDGGITYTTLAGAELYDPTNDSWSPAGEMSTGRRFHTATLLQSGKVLVTGGIYQPTPGYEPIYCLATTELYDPTSNSWSSAGNMSTCRLGQTATLLPSGKVLVAGGCGMEVCLATAELYDPASNMWSPAASMSAVRTAHTATLLPSGKVLVAGGDNLINQSYDVLSSAELYDPVTNTTTTHVDVTMISKKVAEPPRRSGYEPNRV